MNLQKLGLEELSIQEQQETNGGIAPIIVWAAATVGSAVISYFVWKGLDYIFE
jgi:lactobin A/cerein 7B family class IIb bacteriocin